MQPLNQEFTKQQGGSISNGLINSACLLLLKRIPSQLPIHVISYMYAIHTLGQWATINHQPR